VSAYSPSEVRAEFNAHLRQHGAAPVSARWVGLALTYLARAHDIRKLKNSCIQYEGWRLRRAGDGVPRSREDTNGRMRCRVAPQYPPVETGFTEDLSRYPVPRRAAE
jgi:hypothetical protein